eukprot:GAHX01000059.1.p1 GENE.GAHX01000059.1~~GAHX01000059.1.p1  ORF type:complete len:170 (-),score=20.46 GAHX01000059.1:35-499(-)
MDSSYYSSGLPIFNFLTNPQTPANKKLVRLVYLGIDILGMVSIFMRKNIGFLGIIVFIFLLVLALLDLDVAIVNEKIAANVGFILSPNSEIFMVGSIFLSMVTTLIFDIIKKNFHWIMLLALAGTGGEMAYIIYMKGGRWSTDVEQEQTQEPAF